MMQEKGVGLDISDSNHNKVFFGYKFGGCSGGQ